MSQKNFVSYGDAETVLSAFADSINGKEKLIFKGTSAEWEALTAEEQAKYSVRCHPDIDTGDVVDAVTDGDLRAVSSNAVYDKFNTLIKTVSISSKEFTLPTGGYVNWANFTGITTQPRLAFFKMSGFTKNGSVSDAFVEVKSSKYGAHVIFTDVNTLEPIASDTVITVTGTMYYIA